MSVFNKISGGIVVCIGFAVWYIDYLMFIVRDSLIDWIADTICINGIVMFELELIGLCFTLAILLFLVAIGSVFVYSGFKLIRGD